MEITKIYSLVDTTAAADTLTESYGQQWEAMNQVEQSGPLIQFMASNDLIFVVLGVSLIIWLVLLSFLTRLDKKVGRLEERLDSTENKESPEQITT